MSDKRAQRWSFRSQVRDITELPAMRLRVATFVTNAVAAGLLGTETQHPAGTKRHQRNSSDATPTIALEAVGAFVDVSFCC